MPYIKNGVVYTEHDIRQAHPNTSFPTPICACHVEPFGYTEIRPTAKPVDTQTIRYVRGEPDIAAGAETWVPVVRSREERLADLIECARQIIEANPDLPWRATAWASFYAQIDTDPLPLFEYIIL